MLQKEEQDEKQSDRQHNKENLCKKCRYFECVKNSLFCKKCIKHEQLIMLSEGNNNLFKSIKSSFIEEIN